MLQARVDVAAQLLAGEMVVSGILSAEQYREASAAVTKFLPPFQGLGILESRYYPGRRSVLADCHLAHGHHSRFALGYYLSGLRPFQFEPRCLGC